MAHDNILNGGSESRLAAAAAAQGLGHDLKDTVHVGFVSSGPQAEHDVSLRGNGNEGQAFGSDLSDADREALLECLKSPRSRSARPAAQSLRRTVQVDDSWRGYIPKD